MSIKFLKKNESPTRKWFEFEIKAIPLIKDNFTFVLRIISQVELNPRDIKLIAYEMAKKQQDWKDVGSKNYALKNYNATAFINPKLRGKNKKHESASTID